MFLNVALTKINELIKRADFKDIGYLDDKNVTILFENKSCNVNESGRVTWGEHEETETTWLKDSNTKLNKPTINNPVKAVVSEQFKAMAQGKTDYSVDVMPVKSTEYGTLMCVCSDEAAIYITKEQAAKFFGFAL